MDVAAKTKIKIHLNLTLKAKFHRFLPEFGVYETPISQAKSYFLEAGSLNSTGKNNHRMQDIILDSVLMYVTEEAAWKIQC